MSEEPKIVRIPGPDEKYTVTGGNTKPLDYDAAMRRREAMMRAMYNDDNNKDDDQVVRIPKKEWNKLLVQLFLLFAVGTFVITLIVRYFIK